MAGKILVDDLAREMSGLRYQNGNSEHSSSSYSNGNNGHCQPNGDTPTNGCENGYSLDTTNLGPPSPPLFYDDLLGNIPIYNLWMRKFGKDKSTADQGWKEFRQDAIRQYEAFDKRLTDLEKDVHANNYDDAFVDTKAILQKKEDIHAVYMELADYEVEIAQVTKIFEQFSSYLPNGDHRKQVNEMIRDIQQRFFKILQDLDRKKETLLWVIPRLQRYKSSVSDFKTWLGSAESRSKRLERNIDNFSFMLQNFECISGLIEELYANKEVYELFIEPGKGILGVDHQMKMNDLQIEIEELEERWDSLCANIEKCMNKVASEKQALELQNKTEMEKIHIKIQQEIRKCTCFSPFMIVKVDEGKYTFGTSKTVRLLRIHGSSVVVRVGGGWEYLYTFLLKVDPCRAKQHNTSPNKEVDAGKLSALSPVTMLNNKDALLAASVKRLRKQSLPTGNRVKVGGDKLNGTAKSSSLNRRLSDSPATPGSKSKVNDGVDGHSTQNSAGKRPQSAGKRPQRYSLMERQSLYAQKR